MAPSRSVDIALLRGYMSKRGHKPVHSTSGRTTPMMTKLGIVCVMSPIQVL
jgi:hypothetical protein